MANRSIRRASNDTQVTVSQIALCPRASSHLIGSAESGPAILDAAVAFNAAGTFAPTAAVIRSAAATFSGAGTEALDAHAIRVSQISATGAGTFSEQAVTIHSAAVAFACAATFAAAATLLSSAPEVFYGGPVPRRYWPWHAPQPEPEHEPEIIEASVRFTMSARFRARARVIRPAGVKWMASSGFAAGPTRVLSLVELKAEAAATWAEIAARHAAVDRLIREANELADEEYALAAAELL